MSIVIRIVPEMLVRGRRGSRTKRVEYIAAVVFIEAT